MNAQNLLLNGSFESPTVPSNIKAAVTPTSWTSVIPIMVNGGLSGSSWPGPQDGAQYYGLGSGSSLAQAFTNIDAGTYVLSWFDSAEQNPPPTVAPYSVTVSSAGAGVVASMTLNAWHATQSWVPHSMQLSLSPGTYNLEFDDLGTPGVTASLIDDVTLIGQACMVDVQHLSQVNPLWATDLYAYSKVETIGGYGCALTCLCMGLNHAGISGFPLDINGQFIFLPNDPGWLNQLMIANRDYSANGGVIFPAAARDAAAVAGVPGVMFHWVLTSSLDALGAVVCGQGFPVIVGVTSPRTGKFPGHYVLVTGKSGGKFTINDPGYGKSFLDDYGNKFLARGYVDDPTDDVSELDILVDAPGGGANLAVVAPSGGLTGIGPQGQEIQAIPDSVHFTDVLEDELTGLLPSHEFQSVYIFRPTNGTYTIEISGLALGVFTIPFDSYGADGTKQTSGEATGISSLGSVSSFSVTFDKSNGHDSHITRLATFESTLQDIENALALQLIDNAGIASSLEAKIQAARVAAGRGEQTAALNNLAGFKGELLAQNHKHIMAIAAGILGEDAASLGGGLGD